MAKQVKEADLDLAQSPLLGFGLVGWLVAYLLACLLVWLFGCLVGLFFVRLNDVTCVKHELKCLYGGSFVPALHEGRNITVNSLSLGVTL
jgi:hypothetical protein